LSKLRKRVSAALNPQIRDWRKLSGAETQTPLDKPESVHLDFEAPYEAVHDLAAANHSENRPKHAQSESLAPNPSLSSQGGIYRCPYHRNNLIASLYLKGF
jgi:hypothetical protein